MFINVAIYAMPHHKTIFVDHALTGLIKDGVVIVTEGAHGDCIRDMHGKTEEEFCEKFGVLG